jgi:dedicator of cytokinesis protein 1
MLQNAEYPRAHTHRELKERLYYDIIDYFDKGKVSNCLLQKCMAVGLRGILQFII